MTSPPHQTDLVLNRKPSETILAKIAHRHQVALSAILKIYLKTIQKRDQKIRPKSAVELIKTSQINIIFLDRKKKSFLLQLPYIY